MQTAFPPESDLPPPNDDEPIPSKQVGGLKPVGHFVFGSTTGNKSSNNNEKTTGCFGSATGCVFSRTDQKPFGLFCGSKKENNDNNIYEQLLAMRTQINQLNSGIDKIYELLAKNH